LSFHLHADPALPCPAWFSITHLSWFMKERVRPFVFKSFESGDARAKLVCWKEDDAKKPQTFMDFAVYGTHRQNVKLPLCSKPGKPVMTLYRAPANATDLSPTKQLEVGMCVVSEWDAKRELLKSDTVATATQQQQHRRKVCAPPLSAPSTTEDDSRVRVLLEVVRRAAGAEAMLTRVMFNGSTVKALVCKHTATCMFAKRIHRSNQLSVYSARHKGSVLLRCFDPDCSGRSHAIVMEPSEANALFPREDISAIALSQITARKKQKTN